MSTAFSTVLPRVDPVAPIPARIASNWPTYGEDEIAAVADILRSGRVNALHHGDYCAAFEAGFARLCGMPHAIALANGTLALEVALRALGIGAGDEVIVPARSFVATASCVIAAGAMPVFADIDPDTQGLDPALVSRHLTERTRAIIVVHLGGHPAAVDALAAFARQHRLKLIEDCAQAHGATLNGKPVGGFGDAGAFSFCTDKIMSTGGEGGMLVLRDDDVARRAWSLKDHGKDRDTAATPHDGFGFRWLHDHFGSNYRLTEMQAAIGLLQLAKLPAWLARRRANAAVMQDVLADCAAVRLPRSGPNVGHAFYKFYAFLRPEMLRTGWSRDRVVAEARARGVPCFTGICPEIYREAAFVDAGIGPDQPLPIAKALGETSLMLPIDQTLDEDTCRRASMILRDVLFEASR